MHIKPLLLLITVTGCNVVASNQLTFSRDTCEFTSSMHSITIGGRPSYPDSFSIKNLTDSVVVIDTLRFTWRIDGKAQTEVIGVQFDTVNLASGKQTYCAAYSPGDIKNLNDTVFRIDTKMRQQLVRIAPRKSIGLADFRFGRCILCAGTAKKQADIRLVGITIVFVNNRSGKDTVEFRGEYGELLQSGVSGEGLSVFSGTPDNSPREYLFLASGRRGAAFEALRSQQIIPANIYFSKSARVPVMINKKSK